ncbi:uncharacterized protein LOC110943770 [Helianthus annuus]|uniref:uncharacterized protein LOC110943770 n=1 Tax=Helianthus annuus TaxID=4232 RepID=UPI000B901947|nr:uncharacterized protein LOC110943770 [Helianthus annuus]
MSAEKKSTGESPSLSLSFIDDLNPSKDMWTIKCRIIRKWFQSFRMDLILLDEKGRKIQAENTDAYKVVNHGYKINFYRCTVVTRANGWQGVDYGFNFMAHSEILKGEGKDLLTVDVAGTVVWCGDMEIFPNERKRMNLDFQDVHKFYFATYINCLGEVVRCTLWNGYAQQFSDFLSQKNPNKNVMAVIQHVKIKKWQVKQFEAGASSSSQTILSSQSVFPVRQEFLIETPKKHVDEIIEIESVMSCVVVATIKMVQENYGWFYPACRNCNKKVLTKTEYLQYAKIISDEVMNLSPTSLVCPICDKECTSITIKFKVHLRVQDETGSVSFMMFDKDVTKLIGSTASDIRERQLKVNDTESFPHEISRLVEKKLAFKIEVSDYNLNHDYHVYTIQKVFSQEGSEIKAVQLSESSQMAGAAISKDVVSVTVNSSVVEAEKDSGTSPNGKRSLQEVEGQNVGELSSNNKNNRKKSSRVSDSLYLSNVLHILLPVGTDVNEYVDHGDAIFVCSYCHAMLWKDEMLRGNLDSKKSAFSLCCSNRDVELPPSPAPPPLLERFYKKVTPESRNFMNNIRAYNMMFSFTSLGGKVSKSFQKSKGSYVFVLQGQNYHRIDSLLPNEGEEPKFSQLYIYDSQNEDFNRQKAVSVEEGSKTTTKQDLDLAISSLKKMLDSCNPLVKSFRMVQDCFKENDWQNVKLKLIGTRDKDGRIFNLPTAEEIAALIICDFEGPFDKRDIIVQTKSGGLQRISELHPSYLALQYPFIFPYAEDRFRLGIKHRGVSVDCDILRTSTTMREFFSYRIQDRPNQFSLLVNAQKLFQQFVVDAYMMIESAGLAYIKTQQPKLRTQTFKNLNQSVESEESDASNCGKQILLPSSFTGGSRHMMQKYLDAMAICKAVGYPDLFIAVTCNRNWPEIYRCLKDKRLNPQDRPDIIARLFKIKINHLIQDFKKHKFFGEIQAIIYTIEFQKRGLPHAHICLFLSAESKFPTAKEIDLVISAEIPDKETDAKLYELVKQFMIHGPCGTDNPHCPCMVNLKCSKKFPKKYVDETCVDSEEYTIYCRRQTCNTVEKNGVLLDNRFVVPYNAMLLKKYQCHINVEWCNQTGSIKYLFKYINKGPDRVTASIYQSTTTANVNKQNEEMTNNQNLSNKTEVDEVKAYLDCRYILACEAAWRIFKFDIHYRVSSVEILSFHCEDGQAIVYDDNSNLCDVVSNPTVKMTMFTEWMKCNQMDAFARTLKYIEFPRYFVWIHKERKWIRRKRPFGAVGRIHYVSPSLGDCYFLRILLNHVIGPMSFNDIKTVDGKVYDTFKDACFARGLLDDDNEYIIAMTEASTWSISDFLHLVIPEEEIENICLSHIEKLLHAYGSTLSSFSDMPNVPDNYISALNNQMIMKELPYDRATIKKELASYLKSLTDEQRKVYQTIMNAVAKGSGGVFFVYGYGGTGKTFLWKTFAAALRFKGEVFLNVASSGIASLLLDGGRTAHSRFVIPINVNEDSICSIEPNSELGGLIKETKMII